MEYKDLQRCRVGEMHFLLVPLVSTFTFLFCLFFFLTDHHLLISEASGMRFV